MAMATQKEIARETALRWISRDYVDSYETDNAVIWYSLASMNPIVKLENGKYYDCHGLKLTEVL